jgi:hypothetical protein
MSIVDKSPLVIVKSAPTATRLTNVNGPLTKSYAMVNGKLEKNTAAQMYEGQAQRITVEDLNALAEVLSGLAGNQALTFGVTKKASVSIVTKAKVKDFPEAIARIPEHFKFSRAPGIFFIDGDKDHFKKPINTAKDFREALIAVEPVLADASMLILASTSTFIYDARSGKQLIGPGGWHCYIPVKSGVDIPRAGTALYARSWANGCGSFLISKNGSLLDRSLIDQSVCRASASTLQRVRTVSRPWSSDGPRV